MGLLLGRHHIGCAVQEQVVFAQRLAVVGDIQHAAVDLLLIVAQQVNQGRQHVVGIENRVVVGVGYRLAGALI